MAVSGYKRICDAATAASDYSDHYLLTDKSGLPSAVKVLVSDIAGRIFNPLTYTGETTAQAKIQAAINAAEAATPRGTVEIPNGTWEITTGITVTEAIRLVGKGGTINFNPAKTDTNEVNCFAVTASGVVIDSLVIDGSSMDVDEQAGVRRGVYVAGTGGAHVENVTVRNCTITNLVGGGPWLSGGTLPPNTLASHGIYMVYTDHCNVLDNRLDDVNGAGIIFNNCTNGTVQRNRINNTQWGGIDLLQACSHFDIGYNVISGDRMLCRYYANSITLHSEDYVATTHVNVHHNVCSGVHSYGGVIGVSSSKYVNVTDNIIFDVPSMLTYIRCNTRSAGAVYGPACSNVTISGNILIAGRQYANAIGLNNAGDAGSGTLENIIITDNQIVSPDTDNCFAGAIGLLAERPAKHITIANNVISVKPNTSGPLMLGSGAVSVTGTSNSYNLTDCVIIGNHLRFLGTPSTSIEAGICVGGYTEGVIVRNNFIENFLYGLRIETNAGVDVIHEDNVFTSCTIDVNSAVVPAYLGRSYMIGAWYRDNIVASLTGQVLSVEGDRRTEIVMLTAGSIVGISVTSNAARSAGTLSVKPTIDGADSGPQAVLDGTNTTYVSVTQNRNAAYCTFTAGQRIGVVVTTSADFAPAGSAEISVNVLVSV